MTVGTGCTGDGGIKGTAVFRLIGHQHITDALTGQGQGLGIGIANHRVGVDVGQEGHVHAVGQFPIGFVGHNINGMTEFLGLPGQQAPQSPEGFCGVHHTGGVVGGIDDDGLGAGGQHGFHGGQVNLESGHIGGNHLENQTRRFREGLVFREIGGDGQDLAAGNSQGRENRRQFRCGTATDEQVLGTHTGIEPGVQVVGDGLAAGKITHGGSIAVDGQTVGVTEDFTDGIVHGIRCGNRRVAQGIVADVFPAHNGRPLTAVFKEVPDAGPVGTQGVCTFVDHGSTSDNIYLCRGGS